MSIAIRQITTEIGVDAHGKKPAPRVLSLQCEILLRRRCYLGQSAAAAFATLTDPTDPRNLWRITDKQGTRHETQTVTGRVRGRDRASG